MIRRQNNLLWLIFAAVISLTAMVPSVAIAGSKPAVGVVVYEEPEPSIGQFLVERHELGLEYGFDNKEFRRLVERAALDFALQQSGVPQNARSILFALETQIDQIHYAQKNGIDFVFVSAEVREVLEIFVESVTPEGTGTVLNLAKITTAFMTGYTYGFLVGR